MNRKRWNLNGCTNLRDMGGFHAKNGIVSWGKLFRSDLPLLDMDGWNYLYEKGNVRCVIDLRSHAEQDYQTYDICHPQIDYLLLPLIREKKKTVSGTEMFQQSMAENYLFIVLQNPQGLVKVLSTIASYLTKGSVLFHCTAGKDRTGIIACILYLLMGVDRGDILADYQVSATYNMCGDRSRNLLLKDMWDRKSEGVNTNPENLYMLLNYFATFDLESYLLEHGLQEKELHVLKTACIDFIG